jgi:hypothetical protein
MLRQTVMSVAPPTQIIEVEDWDAAIHVLRRNRAIALIAETPPLAQRYQALQKVNALKATGLPIVMLETEASAFSTLTAVAFATTAKNIDELREAAMNLGRADIGDIGIAIVVGTSGVPVELNEICCT